jgi:phage terminase small subunit
VALSVKQRIFIDEYLRDGNATRAAERAGYQGDANTLAVTGSRLLRNAKVDEAIQIRFKENAMGPNEVLQRMAEQARAAYSAYLMPEGYVDLPRLLADGKGHLIKGIKETAHGRQIEFYDAQTALVHIGKHHKLFTDQVEQSGEVIVRVEYGNNRNGRSSTTASETA